MTTPMHDTPLWLSGSGAPYLGDALLPLIHQEAIMLQCRESLTPVIHFWRHRKALLLGSRDLALPGHARAVQWAVSHGFATAVRPFGGQAVLLDGGVQNLTLIIPEESGSLDEGFSAMAALLVEACAPLSQLDVGEVPGSYCPGRFDLSIDGRKVAGIAQRRLSGVIAVSAFMNVRANASREETAARYYELARESELDGCLVGRSRYAVDVVTGSTTSLEDVSTARGQTVWTNGEFQQQCLFACERLGYRLAVRPRPPRRFLEAAVKRLAQRHHFQ